MKTGNWISDDEVNEVLEIVNEFNNPGQKKPAIIGEEVSKEEEKNVLERVNQVRLAGIIAGSPATEEYSGIPVLPGQPEKDESDPSGGTGQCFLISGDHVTKL